MTQQVVNLDVDLDIARPVCPHCGDGLTQLHMTSGLVPESSIVDLVIDTFSCPSCRKILGVGGRK